ncbi:glutamate receptor 3.1 isoform X2 [Selaginella moellendorffii]|uniref:glutamate receptor 3.1 isoform X2 n=1 Tax=Selaginella moellendorffii TaxID=88036 RepID=UPI000D1D0079|nr:glutamate receptor 3.1 isoform X2 [Selaginella moellendorffii]|eukprot:XP_024514977.1 glutamate receptor 3.1 isoform X2 [Selaginella moellendorffii]
MAWKLFVFFLLFHVFCVFVVVLAASPPENVTIGALLALRTRIGRAARVAIQLAVKEINEDQTLLNGTRLLVQISDDNCNAVQGAAAAVELMQRNRVVAIAGPQTSEVAHFVAHMGTVTKIPIVSFSATDPTLSESQYPFFIRNTHSDRIQMEAIADFVKLFEWKEVVALYSDDNFGTNGIMELHDELSKVGATIPFRAAVSRSMSKDDIGEILAKFGDAGGRIFVVHTDASVGRAVLTEAYDLRMLTTGFVWIVTETLSSVLDGVYSDDEFVAAAQGIVGTRSFIPGSPQLERFKSSWRSFTINRTRGGYRSSNVNLYGLYAYDTIWMIAYAIDGFLAANGSFEYEAMKCPPGGERRLDLARLSVAKFGARVLREIVKTKFSGISGKVELSAGGELQGSDLEVVNMYGRGLRTVGYWNKGTGFSVDAPSEDRPQMESVSRLQKRLHHIVWPGDNLHVPRGLMIPKTGRELIIGVPLKQGYKEFVDLTIDVSNVSTFHGFCIDVFKAALSSLPYTVTYSFVGFGDGNSTPSYDELVEKVANKKFDAAVGDITITRKRAKLVDFTQPYTISGLVLVVPVTETHAHQAWAFLQPFSNSMWYTTAAFFFFTGTVVWILERDKNRDFGGRPRKQVVTTFWFIFSTLFFSQRERINSILGRIVVIIWLFVVLILISSYTASLTSILTVRRLRPTIQGLSHLVGSDVRIGYQEGSFVKDYLLQLNVESDRLVPLKSIATYSSALSSNEVGAVVDELPYVQLLLSSDCRFAISGEEEFSKSGWGFAFPKGSALAADVSTAVLTLAETGELQRIHETWLHTTRCSGKVVEVKFDKLDLRAFSGLFGFFAVVVVVATLIHALRSYCQNYRTALLAAAPFQWPSHFSRGKNVSVA